MDREIKLGNYPFRSIEDKNRVYLETSRNLHNLLREPLFGSVNQAEIFDYVMNHFQNADRFFDKNTNLSYHDKNHAVYQSTYDTISTLRAILRKNKGISKHLTPETAVSSVIAASYHDTGYVFDAEIDCNHAARGPIHVEESKKAAQYGLIGIQAPKSLESKKIFQLVNYGIHGTHFPYTKEKHEQFLEWIKELNPQEKKEAQIVRLTVQLADLGGQISRPDYLEHLKRLREEMNLCSEGLGTEIIGEDSQIEEKAKQFCRDHAVSTVGKTANAFFGHDHNIFANEWHKKI